MPEKIELTEDMTIFKQFEGNLNLNNFNVENIPIFCVSN